MATVHTARSGGEDNETALNQACSQLPVSAICVRRFDDSLNSAIHITYRILLRSSSMHEPRDPSLKVVSCLVSYRWLPSCPLFYKKDRSVAPDVSDAFSCWGWGVFVCNRPTPLYQGRCRWGRRGLAPKAPRARVCQGRRDKTGTSWHPEMAIVFLPAPFPPITTLTHGMGLGTTPPNTGSFSSHGGFVKGFGFW